MSKIEKRIAMNTGRLEVIIGPMFAGKSTKLIEIANRYESIQKKILTITHVIDNRYGDGVISSHNKIQKKCITTDILAKVPEISQEYEQSEIIIIEEGQFFPDLKQFVIKAVETDKKHVIVAGLSGDYKREPFGQILELIPLANQVHLITAFCKMCNDGTEANFTKRIENCEKYQEATIVVGSQDIYMPVCRNHYLS